MRARWLIGIAGIVAVGLSMIGIQPDPASASPALDVGTHAAIDAYVEERMQGLKIPGAALAIVKGDQIEYARGYGIADSAGRAVTPQTPFMLASVSKSFTALAIMQLAEDSLLDLDAPVQQYLPWFRVADEAASSALTVRQLLNQTSGFSELDGNRINLVPDGSPDALLQAMQGLADTHLRAPPGVEFEYSNINYGLLGAIVEAVSGRSFGTYVQEEIFSPLGMLNSYTARADALAGGATNGFHPFFGFPIRFDAFMPASRAIAPWAGLFSSAEDMGHYLIANLNEGRYQGGAVVSPAGMLALHTPGVEVNKWSGYAMGWWVDPDFDLASRDESTPLSGFTIPMTVAHEGSWSASRALALMVPQENVGMVLLMNTNDPAIESAFGAVGWDIVSIYFGREPSYYPPREDFVQRNAVLIMAVAFFLLLGSALWVSRKLRTWDRNPVAPGARWRKLVAYGVIPLMIDALLAWFLLARQLPDAHTTPWIVLRMFPDTGLLIYLILLLTLGWGTLRTLMLLRGLLRRAHRTS